MEKAEPADFEITQHGVLHKPSGHRISFVLGQSGKGFFERGHETRVLEFDDKAVQRMARRLWAKPELQKVSGGV